MPALKSPKHVCTGEAVDKSFFGIHYHSHEARKKIRRAIPPALLHTTIKKSEYINKQLGRYSNEFLTLVVRGDDVTVTLTPAGRKRVATTPIAPPRKGARVPRSSLSPNMQVPAAQMREIGNQPPTEQV